MQAYVAILGVTDGNKKGLSDNSLNPGNFWAAPEVELLIKNIAVAQYNILFHMR